MKLIIGGCAQGKRAYALEKFQIREERVWDGVLPEEAVWDSAPAENAAPDPVIIDHFHRWVRNRMLEGGCPEQEMEAFLNRCPDCIVISDEIGNGIVPVEPFEREYRERVGRLVIQLARKAEEVERVICGIGQKIR
ncbi:MAG: bifunctional adenosylcobinamide kinase/adenosylcobinamide-phosphate guanylyltransferase [Blautia sp.]|nr:bifunctional adenosylcobinamide kinase/adenosylcobinamide-phosphate guanylyltransferase [Blautia sp.]